MLLLRLLPLFAALLLASGCSPALRPVANVAVPNVARVDFKKQDGATLQLLVWNDSYEMMVALRDEFVLVTREGTRRRVPGGLASTYAIPAGGVHDVRVKFDLSGLSSGETVLLRMDRALVIRGTPVPVPPLRLVVQD